MDSVTIEQAARRLLTDDTQLMAELKASPPVAMVTPLNDKNGRYLMVSPDLIESAVEIRKIAAICRRTISILVGSGTLTGLSGIEILPRVVRNGRAVRLLRLSVLSSALNRSKEITSQDIIRSVPFDGCTSIIYEKSIYS
jgi:phage portal protein BeeE